MSEKPFRVLLDLTELHIEAFKYVWINVSPRELKTIADLKCDLFKKLSFERQDIKLFVRDGLLLDEETIIVLREDDTVKVQYDDQSLCSQNIMNNSLESKSNRAFHKRSHSECNGDYTSRKAKKHRKNSDIFMTAEEEQDSELKSSKKKKHKRSHGSLSHVTESTVTVVNSCENSTGIDENTAQIIKDDHDESSKNTTANDVSNVQQNQNNNIEVFETAIDTLTLNESVKGKNCHKKKRKRNRKRKDITNAIGTYIPNHNAQLTVATELNSIAPDSAFVRKHIVFSPTPSSNDEAIETNNAKKNFDSGNNTALSLEKSYVSTEDSFPNSASKKSNSYPMVSTPSVFKRAHHQTWVESLLEKDFLNLTPHTNDKSSKTIEKSPVNDVKQIYDNCSNVEDKYESLFPLQTMPEIGSRIAYKILELDSNFTPAVSNYKEGIVKSIDPHSDEMLIELLKMENKAESVENFENIEDCTTNESEIEKTVSLQWSALIEPKLINSLNC